MAWQGLGVISTSRQMIGATNPAAAAPGTVRGDLAIQVGRNVIHGSDSQDSAVRELGIWFPESVANYQVANAPWIYE